MRHEGLMGRFRRWLGRGARRDRALLAIRRAVEETRQRLDTLEPYIRRVHRDVDRIKLDGGLVLAPDRALTLLVGGDRLYVDPRDRGCGLNILTDGRYEEDELRVFRRYLRPGLRMLDIGANYGIYSVVAAPYLRPGGRITAFEPNPHIHALLAASVHVNSFDPLIDPVRLGASDVNGTLRFAIDATGPGGAHMLGPDDVPPLDAGVIEVPVARLDDWLGGEPVDLVKLDVEGHEEQVLRGMATTIARSPDIKIFMELFHPFRTEDEDYARLMRLLTDELGFGLHRILPGGTTVECTAATLRGVTCTLLLSKTTIAPLPDLSLLPAQLNRGEGVILTADALTWEAPDGPPRQLVMIAHGPYVYLPRGLYRLVLDGTFEGRFLVRVMENFGDTVWEKELVSGAGFAADIVLPMDAPRLEVALWSVAGEGRRLALRRVEFWPR